MEEQILFIQYQLWGVLALLGIFVAGNIFCQYTRSKNKNYIPEFSSLWDKGEIDELLNETESYLKEFPHYSHALYFRSRALIKRKRYKEAEENLETLSKNHPEWLRDITELRGVIQSETANK